MEATAVHDELQLVATFSAAIDDALSPLHLVSLIRAGLLCEAVASNVSNQEQGKAATTACSRIEAYRTYLFLYSVMFTHIPHQDTHSWLTRLPRYTRLGYCNLKDDFLR
jgi:hypothetical protein